jgi:hypothetical protein
MIASLALGFGGSIRQRFWPFKVISGKSKSTLPSSASTPKDIDRHDRDIC